MMVRVTDYNGRVGLLCATLIMIQLEEYFLTLVGYATLNFSLSKLSYKNMYKSNISWIDVNNLLFTKKT